MSDIFDYMAWRGDLSLQQDAFGEVDNLIFSMLSFLNLKGICGGIDAKPVPLTTAVHKFLRRPHDERYYGAHVPRDLGRMAERAASCERYKGTQAIAFCDEITRSPAMQFAALTLLLPDGSLFIAFRGTDDSLAGWREDCNMCFLSPVPAQLRAVQYLEEIAARYDGPIRLGGHSKGGNLAVWAAVHARDAVRDRIVMAYSNDGPGFPAEVVASAAYQLMADRTITLIPESSVVGMLLKHDDRFITIKSNNKGIFQHHPFSWDVTRGAFTRVSSRSAARMAHDAALRDRLDALTAVQKQALVEGLFSVLEASGAHTVTEITRDGLKAGAAMLRSLQGLDDETRAQLRSLLQHILKT